MPHYYPIFLNVLGKRCLVVGGGEVALRKVKALLECGANVEVISPDLCPKLSELAKAKTIKVHDKEYEPGDIKNSFLTIAATDNDGTNQKVADEARRQGTLVNVVDSPEQSNFIVPAYLRRGDLTIAVSTAGGSPALARKIKSRLEQDFGEEYTALTNLVKEVRTELKKKAITVSSEDWQRALDVDSLIELLRNGQREKARDTLMRNLKTQSKANK